MQPSGARSNIQAPKEQPPRAALGINSRVCRSDRVLYLRMITNSKLAISIVSGALLFAAAAWADPKDELIVAFFRVDRAIVNGDLNAAKTAASDLAQKAQATDHQAILKDANDLAKADSIDQARQQYRALSEDTLALINTKEASQSGGCAAMMNTSGKSAANQNTGCAAMMNTGGQSAGCAAMMNTGGQSAGCAAMMRCMAGCSGMS